MRYIASADGTSLAVTMLGAPAALPLLGVPPWASTLSAGSIASDELAKQRFVVSYDRRGTGASSRDVADLGLEAQLGDVDAVANALVPGGAFDMISWFDGSPIAIAYAARFPERLRKLVLWHPFVDGARWIPENRVRGLIDLARTDAALAFRTLSTMWLPRSPGEAQRALAKWIREGMSADVFIRSLEAVQATNVVDAARDVRAETLILFPAGAGMTIQFAQEVASLIPNAVLQSVEQEDAFIGDSRVVEMILRFLDGAVHKPDASLQSSGTAVILFTDIADSTALTERMGDAAFRAASRRVDDGVRAAIRMAGGSPVEGKVLGDGVMGAFVSAAQAITAARACAVLGELPMHIGIHAGDVIREDTNVYGGAVNIASRICGLCAPGEIMVTDIVRGLARTSAGVTFEDRGEHTLKGIEDPVRVYAVRAEGG